MMFETPLPKITFLPLAICYYLDNGFSLQMGTNVVGPLFPRNSLLQQRIAHLG